jgi:hypothetical protein
MPRGDDYASRIQIKIIIDWFVKDYVRYSVGTFVVVHSSKTAGHHHFHHTIPGQPESHHGFIIASEVAYTKLKQNRHEEAKKIALG